MHLNPDKVQINCDKVPFSYANKTLPQWSPINPTSNMSYLVLFAITHFKHFTYGHTVYVITDHKPLVSLFKKSVVDGSPCLTYVLMQLLDYTLNVYYQPGERMHLSDALSHLSSHNKATGKTIKDLGVSIHAIEELVLILFQLTNCVITHPWTKTCSC